LPPQAGPSTSANASSARFLSYGTLLTTIAEAVTDSYLFRGSQIPCAAAQSVNGTPSRHDNHQRGTHAPPCMAARSSARRQVEFGQGVYGLWKPLLVLAGPRALQQTETWPVRRPKSARVADTTTDDVRSGIVKAKVIRTSRCRMSARRPPRRSTRRRRRGAAPPSRIPLTLGPRGRPDPPPTVSRASSTRG
jgi:hypothetical protein